MADQQPAKKQAETYKKVRVLGKGSFGKAFLVKCGSDDSYAVVKKIDIQKMSEDDRQSTFREAKILEALAHPNIIRFKEVYKTKQGQLCIVMDYADGGDLAKKISDLQTRNKGKPEVAKDYFSEEQILHWFTQICLALKHTHDRKIIHRDIKALNVFLMKNEIVKLGDFGIARVMQSTNEMAATVVGTPYYLSPEIVQNNAYDNKSDVWSIGVLLYELCALRPPFNGQNIHSLAIQIVSGKYPALDQKRYSPEILKLVDMLLTVDPDMRPSVNELLRFPILRHRAEAFLDTDLFFQEFSHTVLHQQQIFQKTSENFVQNPQPAEEGEMGITPQDGNFPQMAGSDASVPYDGTAQGAESYGYKPWKMPSQGANAESAHPDQDINPNQAANDVLQKIRGIEENRQQRAAGRGGGEVVYVGDAQPRVKRAQWAEGPRKAAEEAVNAQMAVQGQNVNTSDAITSGQTMSQSMALKQLKEEKKQKKEEYEHARRAQIEELRQKRAMIMRKTVEKQRQDDQRTNERKRKIQQEKMKRKQQDQQILLDQKEDKKRQRSEFFAKIKGNTNKQGTRNAASGAVTEAQPLRASNNHSGKNQMQVWQGGVVFELVGVPECMDEPQKTVKETPQPGGGMGDVMVFDMGKKPTNKPKLSSNGLSKAKSPSKADGNEREVAMNSEAELLNLVSGEDKDRIRQSQAEFSYYRRMIDKVMTSDEELRNRSRRPGGELVQLETEEDPSQGDTGMTQAAKASAAIAQTADEEDEGVEEGSDDGEYEYDDDNFEDDLLYEQDMLQQEMVRQQADLEEDRDDDPMFEPDTADTTTQEESKGDDSSERQYQSTMPSDSNWQKMINSHGQENWDAIYEITDEHRDNRFYPEQQEKIRAEVVKRLGGQLSAPRMNELIGLVNSHMCLEDAQNGRM